MSERLKTLKAGNDDPNHQTPATTIPFLPDNVIEKILSFLPLNLAAQATTVSKQWALLWPSFPVIDLDEGCYSDRDHFLDMLHFSIRRCKDQKVLDKLRIRGSLEYGFQEVSEWIDFAIEKSVKELEVQDLTNRVYKFFCITSEDKDVLTLKSLTSLKLENVRMHVSSGDVIDPVSLPLLKTLSLKDVHMYDDFEEITICPLLAGCPSLEHLSIRSCLLNDSNFEISSNSLKSLEIMQCYVTRLTVSAKNLESFIFYSDASDFLRCRYPLPYLKTLSFGECDNLENVVIYSLGLRKLLLHRCLKAMENSFYTPRLKSFEFSGYLKAKIHFVGAPLNLLKATIRIWGNSWPVEYYSSMRDFLESFDCSEKVKLQILDAEGVTIPERCIMEWSSPLPSIKQLHIYFYRSLPADRIRCFCRSLLWVAPSADIVPFLNKNDDDDEDDNADDDDDDDDDEDDEGDEVEDEDGEDDN